MNDEGGGGTDRGLTGKGVRRHVGRDGWKARGKDADGFISIAAQSLRRVSSSVGCKSVIKS